MANSKKTKLRIIGINWKLNAYIKNADILKFIKSQSIKWLRQIYRIENDQTVKKMKYWKFVEFRGKENPRKKWLENFEDDLRRMNAMETKKHLLKREGDGED